MPTAWSPSFRRYTEREPRRGHLGERLRTSTNAERAKLGLAPSGRDAWVSNPTALLTKI